MKWIDTTSYSQSDKERIPRAWTIRSENLTITVHRHIYHDPDVWLISCQHICDCKKLKSKDIELAKNEALNYVASCINNLSLEIYQLLMESTNETHN